MRIDIDHITKYKFSQHTQHIIQLLRLTPQNNNVQNIIDWEINIDCNAKLSAFKDAYGNKCHILAIEEQVQDLGIEIIGQVHTIENQGIIGFTQEKLPIEIFLRNSDLTIPDENIIQFTNDIANAQDDVAKLHQLLTGVYKEIKFETGTTDAKTDAIEAFNKKQGVCQDLAHIFISCARYLGFPSRYVSGHLLRQDGKNIQEAAHAWAETYIDNLGWVAFDPANGICTNDHYVKVAIGLDYRDAAPVSGSRMGGGVETLSVGLHVRKSNDINEAVSNKNFLDQMQQAQN